MTDSTDQPIDSIALDPREESKGTGADTAQTSSERTEAVNEFDHHAESEPAPTLDRSETEVDEGKTLPDPDADDIKAEHSGEKDSKQTSRQE